MGDRQAAFRGAWSFREGGLLNGRDTSRLYPPRLLGTFLSPDALVPDPAAVPDYNRFLYARGNPLKYTDPSGHVIDIPCPLCDEPLLDYSKAQGLADTAIDIAATVGCFFAGCHVDRQANQVTGPSPEEALNSALLGMANPIGMVGVPGAAEGLEQASEQALRSFTRGNFQENLRRLTGRTAEEIKGLEAHHVLPKAFKDRFEKAGINVHDPRFGSWVEAKPHRRWSWVYNDEWRRFLEKSPTVEEILEFGRKQGEKYGFEINY